MRGLSYQSLVPFSLLVSSCFLPLTSEAQTGVITGRVVTEDGTELPGVMVSLLPVAVARRKSTSGSQIAEAMKIELELKPCQRVSDQVVKFR